MKIAIAQLNYTVGAFDTNKIKIINHILKAKEQNAKLVVFAEQAICGSQGYELLNLPSYMELCEEALVEIASHCDDISVIVGLPIQHVNKTLSVAALIQNRRIVRYIGKKNVSHPAELGYITPSEGCEYVTVGDKKVAIVLGGDVLTEKHFGENADIVVNIAAHRYYRGVVERRYNFFKKLSYRSEKDCLFVNQIGGNSDTIYDGSSCAFNNKGQAVAILSSFEEDFKIVDFENDPEIEVPSQSRIRNTFKALKLGLSDYFEKNGFKKACLGLSGGIDSAVVLALAVETLGKENVHVLMMPSQFSSDHSVEDAVEMAANIGVSYSVIPITETFKVINESLIPVIGGTEFDVAEENIQARIRMTMLMALSNKFGHILLNTSNKSEAAIGYDTLYGDSAGSLAVIGDLYKIEVYELARYMNRNVKVIPDRIITKEPSAELRPDQKDTDSLPPYEMLDAILYRFVEEGQQAEEITRAGFDNTMVRKVLNQLRNSEFKRYQACPMLKVSLRPFGSHYRLPLIEHFPLWR